MDPTHSRSYDQMIDLSWGKRGTLLIKGIGLIISIVATAGIILFSEKVCSLTCRTWREVWLGRKIIKITTSSSDVVPLIARHTFSEQDAAQELPPNTPNNQPIDRQEQISVGNNTATLHDTSSLLPQCLKQITAQFQHEETVRQAFQRIDSQEVVPIIPPCKDRQAFMQAAKMGQWSLNPVVISKSSFISKKMASHLMREKAFIKLGQKYCKGDRITNMEGALHTFLNPICPITMLGDYYWNPAVCTVQSRDGGGRTMQFPIGHSIQLCDPQENGTQGRRVILSAAIHPDFEKGGEDEVVMRIVALQEQAIEGEMLSEEEMEPLSARHHPYSPEFQEALPAYEARLRNHMVYYLTEDHRLPATGEVAEHAILDAKTAQQELSRLIANLEEENILTELKGKYVRLNGHCLSLEALFHLYVHRVCNEFSVLEELLPQGYVYLMAQPSIFARQLQEQKVDPLLSIQILNRLQILAFKYLKNKGTLFENLKYVGFNPYADPQSIALLGQVFCDRPVLTKEALFANEHHYSVKESYALIVHNNSDGFGHNIESEKAGGSLDGTIGQFSDAAVHLSQQRHDLLAHLC